MVDEVDKAQSMYILMQDYGFNMVKALLIVVIGIIVLNWLLGKLKADLGKFIKNRQAVYIIITNVGVLSLALVIIFAAGQVDLDQGPIVYFLMIICLVVIGLFTILRPLLPTLPFQVGHTVRASGILGKVEAISMLNTRLRTFDGKTFFVPNTSILKEVVVNYHFTKTRKIMINVLIKYDQDILEAKRLLETVMIEDARINEKPSPVVYSLNLEASGVELGARCWVNNKKFWMTKCDLVEKIKYTFDKHDILFAYPQLEVTHNNPCKTSGIYSADSEDSQMEF